MAKIIIPLTLTILALVACSKRLERCNDGGQHQWGKWSDVWNKLEAEGRVKQLRHCQKCGVAQLEMHR